MVCDPSKSSELVSIIENNKMDIVATSPLDADLRFHKNYNSSFPPSTTHIGKFCIPLISPRMKTLRTTESDTVK